ncbi:MULTISPECIES: hypothetical protein [unclassified Aeromicrobium]|uniref:hypothetical protein n=1 Tax=unclassified Aeromicrobium TaxID=2633570 RepID=UPI000AB03FBF|nr:MULTISPECIES: hypothetical protein [unclassified Aeromicrobium]
MTIFSAVNRTDPSPASHGDSHAQFLDRVSGPYWDQVRALIEDWFSRLCPDAQSDVRGRLRSKDDRQSKGAFFELYVHECLLRMGYAVTCHPDLEGTSRRPDFLAEKDGRSIYVEARSASFSDDAVGKSARVNAVYESLDKMDSPNFFLWIDVVKQGEAPLRARPLRSQLERWLTGLDPDQHTLAEGKRRDDLPGYVHEDAGWKIGFRAVPRSPEARGRKGARPLGIFGGGEAHWVHDEDGIRGALADKGSAYGSLNAPFVIAVASSSISLDDHDMLNALYGSEVVEFRTHADGTEETATARQPDGYWYRGDRWDHRGVSAVLMVKNLHPAFVGTQQHTIWEHPDPEFAVDGFPLWRRSIVEDGRMTFVDPERPQAEWFNLGDPWPVGEPFPK